MYFHQRSIETFFEYYRYGMKAERKKKHAESFFRQVFSNFIGHFVVNKNRFIFIKCATRKDCCAIVIRVRFDVASL